jgi:hypothetical protein
MGQYRNNLNRRQVLQLLAGSGAALYLTPGESAFAQDAAPSKKFLLYIHAGSWDGWAAGLLQPLDVNRFPSGVFVPGQPGAPTNPNLGVHTKVGDLVFHEYSKVLGGIANHLCLGMGNSESAGHDSARLIRGTGSSREGVTGTPGWPFALAQATMGNKAVDFVCGMDNFHRGSQTTAQVLGFGASNPATVRTIFSDVAGISQKRGAAEWAELTANLFGTGVGPTVFSESEVNAGSQGLKQLAKGLPNVDALIASLNTTFTLPRANALLQTAGLIDFDGTIADNFVDRAGTLEKLKTAALLIETKIASGMQISLPNQDFHGGGSEVITARSGANLWSYLTLFWNWVKLRNLQDDVMVIVSHEFSRTAYNATIPATGINVKIRQNNALVDLAVRAPGKDHQLAFGMYFLNGKVPSQSRLGGIGDYYTPAPTKGLNGELDATAPAYTAQQMVCSMLLRVWPEIFKDQRYIRQFYPTFAEKDVIASLLA